MAQPLYREIPYPSSRRMTFDLGKVSHSKHYVFALLEVDITDAWKLIRENRNHDNRISLIDWLIKVLADCVAEHPEVAGFNLKNKDRVLIFRDIDISIVIEKEVNGTRVPIPYVFYAANTKSTTDIHEELESAKNQAVDGEEDYVLGKENNASLMKMFLWLPQWLRVLLMKSYVLGNPTVMKKSMGNVMVTTVGMVGHTHGWIVPTTMHPLCLAFGSINDQPRVLRGEIAVRKVLHITAIIDHDSVDGAPAGRFMDDLVQKLEKGWGL